MQRLQFAAFWFRLAGDVLLDLFLYVHRFCSPRCAHEIICSLTRSRESPSVHGILKGLARTETIPRKRRMPDSRAYQAISRSRFSLQGFRGEYSSCDQLTFYRRGTSVPVESLQKGGRVESGTNESFAGDAGHLDSQSPAPG